MKKEGCDMEEQQTQPTVQIIKNKKPFRVAIIVLTVVVFGLSGLSAWLLVENSNKDKSIANLQAEKTMWQKTGSVEPTNETPPTSTSNRYTLCDKVSFEIPTPWEVYSDTQCKTESLTATSTATYVGASLIPGEKLSTFMNNDEYFTVDVKLVANTSFSPKEIVEEMTGLYASGMTDSNASIGGYDAYYRKVVNDSYTDVNYAVKSNNSDTIVLVYARTVSKHYSYPSHQVDDEKDFTHFESDIKQVAESVRFN
jgi:hypothetical protein